MSSSIKVDIDRGKLITFDLDVQGLDEKEMFGKFRVIINEVEYGFPTTITNKQVEVYVPCLHELLRKDHSEFLKAKLEIFTDNRYFQPWEGKLNLIEAASVKAKVKTAGPKVTTEVKDDVNEEVEVIVDEPEEEVTLPKIVKPKKSSKEDKITEETKSQYLERLKNINMDGIRRYMNKAGTKSEKVQNIIIEQAEGTCRDPENRFELLRSVIKVMNKLKKGSLK